jgi:hypothetical protein
VIRFAATIAALLLVALPPSPASAFCGFFVAGSNAKLTNHASQVVLMRHHNRTVMTMSNTYHGPPENFAMVVPVPVVLEQADVKTLPHNVFDRIDALTAPRLVEYWEQDPCLQRNDLDGLGMMGTGKGGGGTGQGYGIGAGRLGVKVEAQFAVGEYEIVVLSAEDSGGLDTWLRREKYTIPHGAADALAPYVRDQMKFFVAKVNIQKVHRNEHGMAVLSPLRISFISNELRLPVRLGLLNAAEKQDLIVYVLSPNSRYEVANYPNVFVPTNVEVADQVRHAFPSFYAELFDATLARAGGKSVVTEYSWQTSSCDPCPTPPLSGSDLLTLGAGLVEGQSGGGGGLGGGVGSGSGSGRIGRGPMGWVVTRLHTRYDRATLSEDLVFRAAPPVMGGRANWNGSVADSGAQVKAAGMNNFQGRYIIRHYWSGAAKCATPMYGVWGGPPGSHNNLGGLGGINTSGIGSGYGGNNPPVAARNVAMAPRGKIVLKHVVHTPIPSLDIAGVPPHKPKR